MKTICWNDGLEIRAENQQDSDYLHNMVSKWEHKSILGAYLELRVGIFDSDGVLKSEGCVFLEEFDKLNKDGSVFYETNHQEHTGEEGRVTEITFMGFCDYGDKEFKKLLEKEIMTVQGALTRRGK